MEDLPALKEESMNDGLIDPLDEAAAISNEEFVDVGPMEPAEVTATSNEEVVEDGVTNPTEETEKSNEESLVGGVMDPTDETAQSNDELVDEVVTDPSEDTTQSKEAAMQDGPMDSTEETAKSNDEVVDDRMTDPIEETTKSNEDSEEDAVTDPMGETSNEDSVDDEQNESTEEFMKCGEESVDNVVVEHMGDTAKSNKEHVVAEQVEPKIVPLGETAEKSQSRRCRYTVLFALVILVAAIVGVTLFFTLSKNNSASKPISEMTREEYFTHLATQWSGDAVNQGGTPARRALQWLTAKDPMNLHKNATEKDIRQRYIAAVIYYATQRQSRGNRRLRHRNLQTDQKLMGFFSARDVCDWNENKVGIFCDGDGNIVTVSLRKYKSCQCLMRLRVLHHSSYV